MRLARVPQPKVNQSDLPKLAGECALSYPLTTEQDETFRVHVALDRSDSPQGSSRFANTVRITAHGITVVDIARKMALSRFSWPPERKTNPLRFASEV
jgi:hypothetical protein